MFKRLSVFLLSGLVLLSTPCLAEEDSFALDLGVGLNVLVPYGGLRFHYIPEENAVIRWNAALQLTQQFSNTPGPVPGYELLASLGGRYYLIPEGGFQPFLSGDLGLSSDTGFIGTTPVPGLFVLLGVGSDFMFNDSFGMTVAVSSDLNFLSPSVLSGTLVARPELSFKWVF